jgi:hypothetical protein
VTQLAIAYLKNDVVTLQANADVNRVPPVRLAPAATAIGGVRVCRAWAADTLGIALVKAAFVEDAALGEATVLLVLRKSLSQWRLLVATRDPIATGVGTLTPAQQDAFINAVPRLFASLTPTPGASTPSPATLTAPMTGQFPQPAPGDRFGVFTWDSSPSADVVAEIAEFVYGDDVRLFLVFPPQPAAPEGVSAGQLWTTRREWSWRIWSIQRTGALAFSESRNFKN